MSQSKGFYPLLQGFGDGASDPRAGQRIHPTVAPAAQSLPEVGRRVVPGKAPAARADASAMVGSYSEGRSLNLPDALRLMENQMLFGGGPTVNAAARALTSKETFRDARVAERAALALAKTDAFSSSAEAAGMLLPTAGPLSVVKGLGRVAGLGKAVIALSRAVPAVEALDHTAGAIAGLGRKVAAAPAAQALLKGMRDNPVTRRLPEVANRALGSAVRSSAKTAATMQIPAVLASDWVDEETAGGKAEALARSMREYASLGAGLGGLVGGAAPPLKSAAGWAAGRMAFAKAHGLKPTVGQLLNIPFLRNIIEPALTALPTSRGVISRQVLDNARVFGRMTEGAAKEIRGAGALGGVPSVSQIGDIVGDRAQELQGRFVQKAGKLTEARNAKLAEVHSTAPLAGIEAAFTTGMQPYSGGVLSPMLLGAADLKFLSDQTARLQAKMPIKRVTKARNGLLSVPELTSIDKHLRERLNTSDPALLPMSNAKKVMQDIQKETGGQIEKLLAGAPEAAALQEQLGQLTRKYRGKGSGLNPHAERNLMEDLAGIRMKSPEERFKMLATGVGGSTPTERLQQVMGAPIVADVRARRVLDAATLHPESANAEALFSPNQYVKEMRKVGNLSGSPDPEMARTLLGKPGARTRDLNTAAEMLNSLESVVDPRGVAGQLQGTQLVRTMGNPLAWGLLGGLGAGARSHADGGNTGRGAVTGATLGAAVSAGVPWAAAKAVTSGAPMVGWTAKLASQPNAFMPFLTRFMAAEKQRRDRQRAAESRK